MDDAEERFLDAAHAFRMADKAARSTPLKTHDVVFKKVIIDLDAAIPGLQGLLLGRAKLLKAHALWWLHFLGLRTKATSHPLFYDPSAPQDPLLVESRALAFEGKQILTKLNASESDLQYAEDLVAKTE